MNGRFSSRSFDGHATDWIDIFCGWGPARTSGRLRGIRLFAVMATVMRMSHDMSATAEPHHEEDECAPDQKIHERLHNYVS